MVKKRSKVTKSRITIKKKKIVHKKVVRRRTRVTVVRVKKAVQVTFIPEPWSKVTKYKKIKKLGYGGYW